MSDWSRRRALQAVAAAGSFVLAGCGDTNGIEDAPPENRDRVTNYETILVRNSDGDRVFVSGEDDPDQRDPDADVSEYHHLNAPDDLDGIRFRDATGASDLQSFVTATDLESKSVFLTQQLVRECYEPRLVGVFRTEDDVDADFCVTLRPADVECTAGTRDVVAIAIRLPFAGDAINSVGSGWSSDCGPFATVPLTEGGESA